MSRSRGWPGPWLHAGYQRETFALLTWVLRSPCSDSAADSQARAHELELIVATGRCRHRFHADDHGRARPAPGEAADAEVAILLGLRQEAVLAGRPGPGHRVLEDVQTL